MQESPDIAQTAVLSAPAPTSSFVFISYAHADHAFVERLLADLAARDVPCWVDRRGLRPGTSDWEQSPREAIRACSAVLLVASPDSRQSRYVKAELGLAELYGRTIYPLWAAGEQWLESVPFSLSTTQFVDVRGERYSHGLEELVAELQVTQAPATLRLQDDAHLPSPRNPYKGLRAFGEADAPDFFGRGAATAALVDALGATLLTADYTARLLAVVGPSGSGKSSLVLAGLLPQLRRDVLPGSGGWTYLGPIVPGARPLEALTIALAGRLDCSMRAIAEDLTMDSGRGLHLLASRLAAQAGDRVALLVDQAEELFTLTTDEDERRLFLELLTAAVSEPRGPLIVCLTVRADFYHQFLRYPEFWRLLQGRTQYVAPMSVEELREAITAPAVEYDVHLRFEGDLVGDLLFEVRGQESALPLLQFTLDQLVERREDRLLTQAAYHELGGVRGALAAHAEATYLSLPPGGEWRRTSWCCRTRIAPRSCRT